MDSYPEPPFMDHADMPADMPPNSHPDHSPGKQAGGAPEQALGGHKADPAEALPGSSSAPAWDASKAPEDSAMPTPPASKAVQPLVRKLPSHLQNNHSCLWLPARSLLTPCGLTADAHSLSKRALGYHFCEWHDGAQQPMQPPLTPTR